MADPGLGFHQPSCVRRESREREFAAEGPQRWMDRARMEELSEMRYGIEILPLPVMGGQVRRRRGSWAEREGEEGRGRRAAVESVAEA